MDGADFEDLLTGDLAATVLWQQAIPCPCVQPGGGADRSCRVCLGFGTVYGRESGPFRCGLVGQTAKVRAQMMQMMGPAAAGNSVLVLPMSAPCYMAIREGDRIWDIRVEDQYRVVVQVGTTITLPPRFRNLQSFAKDQAGEHLVWVNPPDVDELGLINPSQTSTLQFQAPRGYEVVRELSQVRSFGEGLPKRLSLALLDASLRSKRAAQIAVPTNIRRGA